MEIAGLHSSSHMGTYCKSKDQDMGMIWSHSVESFEPKKCGIKELISESRGVVFLVSRHDGTIFLKESVKIDFRPFLKHHFWPLKGSF